MAIEGDQIAIVSMSASLLELPSTQHLDILHSFPRRQTKRVEKRTFLFRRAKTGVGRLMPQSRKYTAAVLLSVTPLHTGGRCRCSTAVAAARRVQLIRVGSTAATVLRIWNLAVTARGGWQNVARRSASLSFFEPFQAPGPHPSPAFSTKLPQARQAGRSGPSMHKLPHGKPDGRSQTKVLHGPAPH